MRCNSIEYEFIHLAIPHDFLVPAWFPSARNNLLIVVNHKRTPAVTLKGRGSRGQKEEST